MTEKSRKLVSSKVNSKGINYCLISGPKGFEVWKLCENYNRHAKGGIIKTWRYVERGMTREDAEKLFNRRTK